MPFFSLLIVWEATGSQVFVNTVFERDMSLRSALQFNSRMAVADKTETSICLLVLKCQIWFILPERPSKCVLITVRI